MHASLQVPAAYRHHHPPPRHDLASHRVLAKALLPQQSPTSSRDEPSAECQRDDDRRYHELGNVPQVLDDRPRGDEMAEAAATTVTSSASREEIERTLIRYGADQFMYGWQDDAAMIAFRLGDRQVRFVLPMPSRGEKRFTHHRRGARIPEAALKEWEQAIRQRWRALALVGARDRAGASENARRLDAIGYRFPTYIGDSKIVRAGLSGQPVSLTSD